ncbi:hypothetical protein F5B21DRAFT_483217 [Xylaria acuta]|nr:hypothetical protein F5B21DRAFT_483217 [Xylaria acuta]
MSSSTAEDKRRLQNRESQRRYRKRQRMDSKNPNIDIMQHYQLRLPMNRDDVVPCPSTTALWAGDSLDSGDHVTGVFSSNRVVRDFHDAEGGETSVRSQSCDSTQTRQSMNLSSLPAADRDSQRYDLVQAASTSRLGPTPSPVALPFAPEGYNPQIVWNTPPASAYGTISGRERIIAVNPGHENRSTLNASRVAMHQISVSRTPKVNSRAVEMITEVEKLYEFGVSIGILPEARDTKRLLNRMKHRFMSLTLSASTDVPDATLARSTDEDSDSS